MYKININANYFESNLKINQETKESNGKNKAKFSLTQQQKQFIQSCLPHRYKLNIASEIDEKRNRTPKKTDAQFDTQFFKKDQRKDLTMLDKKNEKKQQKKAKEKTQFSNSNEQAHKNKRSGQQAEKASKEKQQNISKKKGKNVEIKIGQMNITKQRNQQVWNQKNNYKQKQQHLSIENHQNIATESNKKKQGQLSQIKKQFEEQEIIMKSKKSNAIKQQNEKQIQKVINIGDQPVHLIAQQNSIFNQAAQKCAQPNYVCRLTTQHKQLCLRIITKLRSHKASWPFRLPVDPIAQGVPNYLQVIHEPMDIKTIQKKVNLNKYEHIAQFYGDVNKIFLNSYKFNPKQTNYYTLTIQLQDYYHQLLKQVENNPNIFQADRPSRTARTKSSIKPEQDFIQQQTKKNRPSPGMAKTVNQTILGSQSYSLGTDPKQKEKQKQREKDSEKWKQKQKQKEKQKQKQKLNEGSGKQQKNEKTKMRRKFSDADKRQLIKKIHKSSSKLLESIVEIIYGNNIDDEMTTFELDFKNIPDQTLARIQKIVQVEGNLENIRMQSPMFLF